MTQFQIIQSLGEAISWLEREQSWKVPPTELRHLIGRIGELYVALITNGRMASEVNQRGYDVISKAGENISVKTTAKQDIGGHIAFNPNTLDLCHRVMILFFDADEMQIDVLFDDKVERARDIMVESGGKLIIATSKLREKKSIPIEKQTIFRSRKMGAYKIYEMESGTIRIEKNGQGVEPVKPVLREICRDENLPIVNENGVEYTTRQLGSIVLKNAKN